MINKQSLGWLLRISIVWAIGMAIMLQPTPDSNAQQRGGMVMPMNTPPGPSTWMFGQPYGNTTGSYRFGLDFYEAGQGLHFGLDFPMPCGTELVAVADGEVVGVDNLARGAGPHNLLIYHPALGVTTLYGHLLERPSLALNEPVRQGQVVGLSGDPDSTCVSRPHLHLEVRSRDTRTAYNPIDFIDANWNMLTSIGAYSYPLFQQDLYNPRNWMNLFDQPDVAFGGRILNRYTLTYPPTGEARPPFSAAPTRTLDPLPTDTEWQFRRVTYDDCCAVFWWHPTDPDVLYMIDGAPGNAAAVMEWNIIANAPVAVPETAPPSFTSPDGSLRLRLENTFTVATDLNTGTQYSVNTSGRLAAINADNTRMMWVNDSGNSIPGSAPAPVTIWTNNLAGTDGRLVREQRGGSASWIDPQRILLSTPVGNTRERIYEVWNSADGSTYELGRFTDIRNVSISPGGQYMMYYLRFQPNPADDGVYFLPIQQGALPVKMNWFGAWQWRDSNSLYVMPFEPSTDNFTLAYYEVNTGRYETLITPDDFLFSLLNGAWDVSADGRRILYQSAFDNSLYVIEQVR